jgi:peptidoglycan hydrolase-like protein with peptidoglycan-binding domain
MKTLLTAAWAVALGIAWSIAPATAQETAKDKAERAADKVERKAERAGDKLETKTERAKDKIETKSERAGDKTESTMDKLKDKAREAKEKVKDKWQEVKGRAERTDAENEVKTAQQALQEKGHNPGPIDGKIGPRTTAAIRSFQKAEGLQVTGHLDDATRAKLGMERAAAASPATDPSKQPPAVRRQKP